MTRKRLSDLLKEEVGAENPLLSSNTEEIEQKSPPNLDQEIQELKTALASQTKTTATLKAKIQDKEQEIKTLQEQLIQIPEKEAIITAQQQQIETLTTELTQQKQLVETLYEKLQTLEQKTVKPRPPSPKSTPKPAIIPPSSPRPMARYVSPTNKPNLTNEDIGWFD